MRLTEVSKARLYLSCFVLLVVLFLDIILPLDVNVDPLFILCLFLVMKEHKKIIILFSLLILFAFITVFCIEMFHYEHFTQYLSKSISLCTIIAGALIVLRYNRLQTVHVKAGEQRIQSLENIVFMTSHKIRVPVTNILGLAELVHGSDNSPEDDAAIIKGLKDSAGSLDVFTRELAAYLHDLRQKNGHA